MRSSRRGAQSHESDLLRAFLHKMCCCKVLLLLGLCHICTRSTAYAPGPQAKLQAGPHVAASVSPACHRCRCQA